MFCSIYFFHVIRKLVLYQLFWPKRMVEDELEMPHRLEKVDGVRTWFKDEVCGQLSNDAFDDCYNSVLVEAYRVPGDHEWFVYCFPERASPVGSLLQEFRPNLAVHYFQKEERTVKDTLWAVAEWHRHGFVARAFVFKAMDDYMLNHFDLEWRNFVVIEDGAFDERSTKTKLYGEKSPFLIQIMSRYWVFDNASWEGDLCYVWPTDCIYESIAVWFHILRTRYGGVCFGVDLTPLIGRIFQAPTPIQIANGAIVNEL